MDAKVVEGQIRDKLGIIGDSIASFLNVDETLISNRLKALNFYVYEDYYNQSQRLTNVDLAKIASDYASDVYENLLLDEEREKELANDLTKLILSSYHLDDVALKPIIEDFVSKQDEFKNTKNAAYNNIKSAIKNFLRDYEVRDIIDNLQRGETQREKVVSKMYEIKADILRNKFNVHVRDTYNVGWLWDTLSAFTLNNEDLKNCSEEYKNHIYDLRKKFYSAIGCRGGTLQQLEESAKKNGIVMNKQIALDLEHEFCARFVKECKSDLRAYTNIFDIYDELESKGYTPDFTNVAYMFNNPSVYGVNFQIEGKRGLESYVVFANNEMLYTTEFNDTCIHELIHYLGGINETNNKRGLYFNDSKAYLDLEEAYVNALSKKVMGKVVEKSGNIISPCSNADALNVYDHTLEYMEFVFKRYKKELSKVHLSTTMNLAQANRLLPFDNIAKGVSRIMNCDKKDVKKYTLEEIEKLKKIQKKK